MAGAGFEGSLRQKGLPRAWARGTDARSQLVLGRIARTAESKEALGKMVGVYEETEATAAIVRSLRAVGRSDGRGTGEGRLLRRITRSARKFGLTCKLETLRNTKTSKEVSLCFALHKQHRARKASMLQWEAKREQCKQIGFTSGATKLWRTSCTRLEDLWG